jgi:hypothetical protein
MSLLSFNSDAKTVKGQKLGFYTGILYLIPDDNLCAMAEKAGCREGCLVSAGRGAFTSVAAGRKRKTDLYYADPVAFVDTLAKEITLAQRRADKRGETLVIRLNGTSDIAFENKHGSNGLSLMDTFPTVQFYDYTKLPTRKVPANYHLTVSYSGANDKYASKVLKTRHNIAVVFRSRDLPKTFGGRVVVDGDKSDLRFLDDAGVIVGLYAKGAAKRDNSGFVIDNNILAIG